MTTREAMNGRFTVIEGGGGGASGDRVVQTLRGLPPRRRLDAIIESPDSRAIVRSLPPPDLHLLVKEIGLEDLAEIIEMASPEQVAYCIDLEIWRRWIPSLPELYRWLAVILEGDESSVLEKIRGLDPELLVRFLQDEILVGGGPAVVSNPEDQLPEYEHTFDSLYYLSFRNREHSTVVARLLEILCVHDNGLYVTLLEGVRSELPSDLEEESFRFREGRLSDHGFPDYESARALHSYQDPDRFPLESAIPCSDPEIPLFPVLPDAGDLFCRCFPLVRAHKEQELTILMNHVLMLSDIPLDDAETLRRLLRRTTGYLSLAMEQTTGPDEAKGIELLRATSLKSLYRLGFSITMTLRHRAARISQSDAAANLPSRRALEGLLRVPPVYYRGFDDELLDDFREFRTLADVERASQFLDGFGRG